MPLSDVPAVDWQSVYHRIKPVMGSPDDTDFGHQAAVGAAKVHFIGRLVDLYDRGDMDGHECISRIRQVVVESLS
jgi:hypothetical protein